MFLPHWGISTNPQFSHMGLKRTEEVLDQRDAKNITSQAIVHQDQNVQPLLLYKLAHRLRLKAKLKKNTFGCPQARLWPCHQPRQRTWDTTTTHQDKRTYTTPVSRMHWPNFGSLLGQRLRRWPNNEPTLSQCWEIVCSSWTSKRVF